MAGRGGIFELVEHMGAAPGPIVALLGGIHGDEDEGVLAVQRVSAAIQTRALARGRLRAVAVSHPAAYAADRRTSPLDGKNLARCFPGDPAGSATERLAHDLTERVIRGSDLLIDLHSAGRAYTMPTFVGYMDTRDDVAARARRAAVAFGAPLLWEHPVDGSPPPGRTLSAALEFGIPAIYVEGSGGGSLEQAELEVYVSGVLSVLAELEMAAGERRAVPGVRRIVRGGAGDLDAGIAAPCSGRFVVCRAAGDALAAGERIGEIVDETGAVAAEIVAPLASTLMFVRRSTRIAAGEVVCSLGATAEIWSGG